MHRPTFPAFLVAVVPDEDPDQEPTVHIHSHDEHIIPYDIMHWFMQNAAEEVERRRLTLEHHPLSQDTESTLPEDGRP